MTTNFEIMGKLDDVDVRVTQLITFQIFLRLIHFELRFDLSFDEIKPEKDIREKKTVG